VLVSKFVLVQLVLVQLAIVLMQFAELV